MTTYVVKRLLLFIPTLIAITIITFTISRLAPGDPTELKVGVSSESMRADEKSQLNQQAKEYYKQKWGLDKPIYMQYIIWLGNMATGDFGNSFIDNRPVIDKIIERLPITVPISLSTIFIAYLIAIPIGIYSAARQYSFWDRFSTFILFVLYSLPSFWIATMAIIFLANVEYLKIFPTSGLYTLGSDNWSFFERTWDRVYHLILPIACYTYGSFAFLSRQMRGSMLEVIRQDYIRTARAKGLKEKTVVMKHALRNSLIPIITLFGGIFPALVGGSVIIETIFSIPGLGQLAFQALVARDYPLIMAELVIAAVMTLIGLLIVDILYAFVDPRIAFTKKSA
ncbi:MAG: ABC transporter permease [Ignavibacteriae bacterium]|nr:MAG: ABC transporter permease [Ignavibacteriota bacterium]